MSPNKSSGSKNPALVASLSGAIAGGIETTCIWPMEMIKTNLQLGTMKGHYGGMWSGFHYHITTLGPLSLYRGLAPVLVASIPKAAIRFGGFHTIKKKLSDEHGHTTPLKNLAAGMSAGAIEAFLIVTPVETIKTKLIDINMGVVSGTKHILKTYGIAGIYKGLSATVMKQASNQGLRFMWFSEYKRRMPAFLEGNNIVKDYSTLNEGKLAVINLIGGMSAGCFSCLGNNPFDVIKTRMQGTRASQYKGTLDCISQIARNEGILAFYSGIIPRLSRVVPGQGVIFVSYDSISRFVSSKID